MSQDNSNNGGSGPAKPFSSAAELTAAMQDVRYAAGDPEYIALVKARLNAAPAAAKPAVPFADIDALVEAQRDPRYTKDEQYRAEVDERLKVTDLGVSKSNSVTLQHDGRGGFYDPNARALSNFAAQQAAQVERMRDVNVPGVGPVTPFFSHAELVAAMSDKRYTSGDPAFHAIVTARLAVSKL